MSEPTSEIPNNNELAMERTDMAGERTVLAVERTDLAETRTELARERTRASQERTLMAWIRTSLSMITFGFGIDRFFKYLDRTETGIGVNELREERILGLSLMSLGIFALGASLITHWRTLKNIEQKEFKYTPRWSQGFTVGIILLFIGLAAFIPLFAFDFNLVAIFTPDSQVIKNLVSLTLFLIMLTMGVKIPFPELISLKNNPFLLFKSLISVLILFPLVVALVLLTLQPAEGTLIGLVLLAASPAPPLLTKMALIAGGNVKFAASLQVIFSLLAVGFTPLILFLFSPILPMEGENVNFLLVAKQIATVQFFPLSIGLVIRKISADLGEEIGNLLFNVAETLFIVFVVLLLCVSLNLIPLAGSPTFMAIAVIVPLGLIIGHVLGGVDHNLDTRSTLATATIARNLGLALFLAIVDGATNAIPCIISYGVLGAVLALPYNVWVKKQMKIMGQN